MLVSSKAEFKRPKHLDMIKQGYTLFDMHHHSTYSDGIRKVSSIAKKAKRLGIGVAITDHNEIRGTIEISKIKDVNSIPGIEVTTKEGIHVLVYFYNISEIIEFYNHHILPNKSKESNHVNIGVIELIEASKDYNCKIVAPHPYSINMEGICSKLHSDFIDNKILSKFDAIEVINGSILKNMNLNAISLAETLNSGITGGSDGHRLEVGKVVTYTKNPVTKENFLDEIKNKNTFVTGRTNMVEKIATHSTKIKVAIKHPIIYTKIGYDYLKQRM